MPSFPVRFSMRTLLIATTAFAVWCVAVVILPREFTQIVTGLITYVIVAWLATGLVFCQGDIRAFCLGALLVITSMWTGLGGHYMNGIHAIVDLNSSWSIWFDLVVVVVTGAANGWVCIKARRYFQRDF